MHAMLVDHYFGGAAYPVGGSCRIAETIIPAIKSCGGEVITNAPVDEIIVKNGKCVGVRLENGREFNAKVVVSNAGLANTCTHLLPEGVGPAKKMTKNAEALGPSVAHLSLYVGLDATDEEMDLKPTNHWVYDTPNHEENVRKFVESGPTSAPPLVYLSFPSAKDPDFSNRFPGKATVEDLTLAPYEWFAKREDKKRKQRGDEYDQLKAKITENLLEVVYRRCPKTRGHVQIAELSTPLSTRNFVNFEHGEIYGITHAPSRFEHKWLRPRTPIKGLYLTGADVVTAGIAGAMMGGVISASAIADKNLMTVAR